MRGGAIVLSAGQSPRWSAATAAGQVLHRNDVAPETAADVLIDNEDPASPVLIRYPSSTPG